MLCIFIAKLFLTITFDLSLKTWLDKECRFKRHELESYLTKTINIPSTRIYAKNTTWYRHNTKIC